MYKRMYNHSILSLKYMKTINLLILFSFYNLQMSIIIYRNSKEHNEMMYYNNIVTG